MDQLISNLNLCHENVGTVVSALDRIDPYNLNNLCMFQNELASLIEVWTNYLQQAKQISFESDFLSFENAMKQFAEKTRLYPIKIATADNETFDSLNCRPYLETPCFESITSKFNPVFATETSIISQINMTTSNLIRLRKQVDCFRSTIAALFQRGNLISLEQYSEAMDVTVPNLLLYTEDISKELLLRSIIITNQPPLIVLRDAINRNSEPRNSKSTARIATSRDAPKCQTTFSVNVKILAPNILTQETIQEMSFVEATMISKDDAVRLIMTNSECRPKSIGELTNSKCPLEVEHGSEPLVYSARFSSMRIRKICREKARNVESMQYSIMFRIKSNCTVTTIFGNQIDFDAKLVSLPFCVIVNPNQRARVLPSIFWSRAFDRLLFGQYGWFLDASKVAQSVPWTIFSERLNELFTVAACANTLNSAQLDHLASKLFGRQSNYAACSVTFDLFSKKPMQNWNAIDEAVVVQTPFWEWFYSCMEIICHKKFRPYWNENYVVGFVSRENVDSILSVSENCMMIKFSDTMKGALVLSFSLHNCGQNVIHVSLDNFCCKELSLRQCVELLFRRYSNLKSIKYVLSGTCLQSQERKQIDEFLRIDLTDLKGKQNPSNSNHIDDGSMLSPYVQTEWQLCLQDPRLHKSLQGISPENPETDNKFNADCSQTSRAVHVTWPSSMTYNSACFSNVHCPWPYEGPTSEVHSSNYLYPDHVTASMDNNNAHSERHWKNLNETAFYCNNTK